MTTDTTFAPETAYQVPPGSLLLERNIRDSKPSPDLVTSVAKIDVLEPITVVVKDDGRLMIRTGHRRALAAIEAGLETVPVYVVGTDAVDDAREVDRIIRQRDENTHRDSLTAGEELGVVEQLVAFGLSVDEISKQARIPKDRVETAVDVAASKLAKKATEKYADLTLDQAAAVAEFDDDPDTAKALLATALKEPRQFDHTLQRAKDDRAREQARAAAAAALTAEGVTIVDRPDYDAKWKRLSRLVEVNSGKQITPANHKKCPGHVAYIDGRGDVQYGCADAGKYGHRDQWASSSSPRPAAADMTDAQRAKAKEERRVVVENNRAWTSAQTVRREWLKVFAKYKNAPKGAAAFVATGIGNDSSQFAEYDRQPDELTASLLGLKHTSGRVDLATATANATEGRALQIALIHVLAVYEIKAMHKNAWRLDGTSSAAGRYLRFLEACGYPLSDVEKYAISKRTV